MKHIKSARNSYSLVMVIRRLLLMVIPILIISVIISTISVLNIKRQSSESIRNTVSLYQDTVSTKLNAIEHFILWSIVNEPLLDDIEEAQNLHERSSAISSFRNRAKDSLLSVGTEYHYFFYQESLDLFFNASGMSLPYQDYQRIKTSIVSQAEAGGDTSHSFIWQTFETPDANYLCYVITYRDRTFAVYIDAASLAEPLTILNLGNRGELVFADRQGNEFFRFPSSDEPAEKQSSSPFYYHAVYSGQDSSLPFDILLYSDFFSNYGGMLFWQLIVCITALGLAFILCGCMFYMYFSVIRPIREFSDNLSSINERKELINLQSNSIRELEQASVEFKNLIREIKRLKIEIYEQELDKKKFQITFLQHQIRPHFYLNCLTTISSMAQLGKTKDIQSMVLFTSRYLHYLFQTDKELVQIKYELDHIQAYLDIQAMRYGPVFTYRCTLPDACANAMIPPLLLITFVENTIKHGEATDGNLRIFLSVQKEPGAQKDYLKIDISDSGQGFSDELLQKLSDGTWMTDGDSSHVGIRNSLKRLKLLYGTDYSIEFFNETEGGAHIRLLIPCQIMEGSK